MGVRTIFIWIFLVVLTMILLDGSDQCSGETEISSEEPPLIFVKDEITINVVLVGFDPDDDNELQEIEDYVTDWYIPYVLFDEFGPSPIGVKYTIDLQVTSAPEVMLVELCEFYNDSFELTHEVDDYFNGSDYYLDTFYDLLWGEDDYHDVDVNLLNARDVEDWLKINADTYPGLKNIFNDYTLFLMLPYYSDFGYYYFAEAEDPDEIGNHLALDLNAYGGNYNFYFMDWWALPPNFGDRYGGDSITMADLDGYSPAFWSLINDIEFESWDIAVYINEIIEFLFLHSYLYPPEYELKFELDLVAFDCTEDDDFYDIAHEFINQEVIIGELSKLVPYANWTFEILKADIDDFPDLKDAYDEGTMEEGALILDSTKLLPACDDMIIFPDGYVTIPCMIFITDDTSYLDDYGTIGSALSYNEMDPWGIIITKSINSAFDEGLTCTVIHEIGHTLGLMHPHHNVAETEFELSFKERWQYDFSSTVMGYYDDLSNYQFSTFDHDTLNRGHCLELMDDTLWGWYAINQTLLEKRYKTESMLPIEITTRIIAIKENFTLSLSEFKDGNYYDPRLGKIDSWELALNAYTIVNETWNLVIDLPDHNYLPEFLGIEPSDGAKDQPINLELLWYYRDNDFDDVIFTLFLGAGSMNNITLHAENLTMNTYPLSLSYGTVYFWKLIANDGIGQNETIIFAFLTEMAPEKDDEEESSGELIPFVPMIHVVIIVVITAFSRKIRK